MNNIGNTPLIRLINIEKEFSLPFRLYAKDESKEATGSIKDRPALEIITNAINNKELIPGISTIVEATSGNMGISLAYVAKQYDINCRIYMPVSASIERRKKMEALGAEVILVNGGMKECNLEVAKYIKNTKNAYLSKQFSNIFNPLAHEKYTSKEIIDDLGKVPNYFIAGVGTGGTLIGCARTFKKLDKNVKIVGVEPLASPLLTKGYASSHKIQGIGANFIPDIYQKELVDDIVDISDEEAYEGVRLLYKLEKLFNGISSGAALMGAIKYKDKIAKDNDVVIILPDSGDRYLSIGGLYE